MNYPSFLRNLVYAILCLFLLVVPYTQAQDNEVNDLIKERRFPEAVSKLETLAESSKNVETRSKHYHQLAETYYNYTHQYPEAIKTYEKIIRMRADGLPMAEILLAYLKMGDVHSRMGEYQKAIDSFRRLIGMAPETHFVYEIGQRKIRDIRTSLKNLEIQQNTVNTYKGTPLEAVAQFQIAELYRTHTQLNQPERAIKMYEDLLENFPTDKLAPEAQWRIAHIRHTVLHQLVLAVEAYKNVADNFPTTNFAAEALFHIANLQREDNKYQTAINEYNSIIEKYPNFWNMHAVYYWLGICYEQQQNYKEAQNAFKIFQNVYLPKLDPVYLGQISMYDKNVDEVKELIKEKINTLSQTIPKHEFEKFEKAAKEKQYEIALIIAQNLIATDPKSEYSKKVDTQLQSLKHLAMIQKLMSKIQNDAVEPNVKVRTQLQIATIYERELLDYAKAVELYNEVIQAHFTSAYAAEALYRIGIINMEILEKPNSALQTFNAITSQHPNTLQAMMATFQVGEIYRKLQRYDEALKAYHTTIAYPERELYLPGGYKDSYADRAQFRIGRVHFEDQRFADARYAFEEFIRTRTVSPRLAAAYLYLAVLHQENGEKKKAEEYYQKAEKTLTENPIQMQIAIDEAGTLGFQSQETVLTFIQERIKRLKTD